MWFIDVYKFRSAKFEFPCIYTLLGTMSKKKFFQVEKVSYPAEGSDYLAI